MSRYVQLIKSQRTWKDVLPQTKVRKSVKDPERPKLELAPLWKCHRRRTPEQASRPRAFLLDVLQLCTVVGGEVTAEISKETVTRLCQKHVLSKSAAGRVTSMVGFRRIPGFGRTESRWVAPLDIRALIDRAYPDTPAEDDGELE